MSKFGEALRGLTVFISDIRNCKSKEAEKKRINKELANIRSKFKGDKLDGYQKKKYVCKMVFIFLLGNDIDFGYQEAVNLLSSSRFSEKQIGYLFVSVIVGEGHDLMPLIIQAIRHDVESQNPVFNTLAMQCIANIASKDMAEQLGKDIPPVLTNSATHNAVKQTAALCLLKMLRVSPKSIPIDQHAARIVQLLNDRHMGVVTAACSLLEELAHINSFGFSDCVPLAVTRLSRIVTASHSDLQDYIYYFVPAPWLTVKLLRLLQCFEIPDDAVVRARLSEALEVILNRAQEPAKSKKIQYSNSKNSVLFEGINLILHFQGDPSLQVRSCNLLGGYLTHKETNMRYMSLETLSHLAISDLSREAVKKHQDVVLKALKTEKDISVRQRAIDLLYAMCDHSNAKAIVEELLEYLEKADYSIRETLVLKIAILSEKYATDFTWYVDTILNLIRLAGDYVSEEVWYRIIQIVINREDVQGYAAKTCFESLQAPACHENMIKVGGYILGEFGNLIAGDNRSSPLVQFQLLHSKFHLCSVPTRALLLSTYIKFINLFPEIKSSIQEILKADNQLRNANQELQQRAIEYFKLSSIATTDLLATVLEEMPAFPDRESSLLNKLYETAPWTAKLHQTDDAENGTSGTDVLPPIEMPTIEPEVNIGQFDNALITTDTPSTAAPATTSVSDSVLLVDVLGGGAAPITSPELSGLEVTPGSEEGFLKFQFKNNGVLFENDILQIGVKAEYKTYLGRLAIFYGNKSTSTTLQNFTTTLCKDPQLENRVKIDLQSTLSTIEGGAQKQQLIDIECKNVFLDAPKIAITFNLTGAPHRLVLKLPVFITKFMESSMMSATDFFSRWKQLAGSEHEAQKVFPAKFPIEYEHTKTKLLVIGLSVMDGIDPNPENFVSAGIVKSKEIMIGCLVRLEPNKEKKLYRLTVRTSNESMSQRLCDIVTEQV